MRRHGWSGDIPADDEEAVARILTATRRAIDERGTVSVSQVASTLGVTRQTIYRYFPTHEALLGATALSAVEGFLDRLAAHLGSITDPTEAVVEGIAYTFEQLAHDRYLSLVFQPGKASAFTAGVTSDIAISFGRSILQRFEVDWGAAGFADAGLDELVEVMLRTLQSLIVDPGRPPRTGAELRRFLRDWVAPSVRAHAISR
ncbi:MULTISPECIES: TetR/AcrR family transcriptional regulator [Mycobacterium avium complex (MAC)]|uniref:TetR family transcriptional regulator n=4 Tax=Mycobacterium avium complex (MAC) TaxID=120793 RepID=A0ABX3TTU8_9MYCO|nr:MULTISPECIES: TetR/AcrR family transcriptional regulator [Mycobacterium avium complex (MAC)]ANR93895.1 TetR family transcriptional regulator [Mycobacterium avium]ATO65095.2 TetR/AcrR family transcriptional regulator [Mycobacterium avium subsp. hominissuis]AYJ07696.1 TetR/AcrR family transcriptional regulator [Mycobacterium avium]ETZ46475.1 bacterial regulatory s, tetR family protein [Mycobacterium avium MAV_061107_1842]ETZ52944.1 bacterial regulatory s, tetR family protein [Mycobacterium av